MVCKFFDEKAYRLPVCAAKGLLATGCGCWQPLASRQHHLQIIRGKGAGTRHRPKTKVQRLGALPPSTSRSILAPLHVTPGRRTDPTEGMDKETASKKPPSVPNSSSERTKLKRTATRSFALHASERAPSDEPHRNKSLDEVARSSNPLFSPARACRQSRSDAGNDQDSRSHVPPTPGSKSGGPHSHPQTFPSSQTPLRSSSREPDKFRSGYAIYQRAKQLAPDSDLSAVSHTSSTRKPSGCGKALLHAIRLPPDELADVRASRRVWRQWCPRTALMRYRRNS